MLENMENEIFGEADAEFLMELGASDDEASDNSGDPAQEVVTAEEVPAEEKDPREEYLRRIEELEEKLRLAEEERSARERELLCLSLLEEAGLPLGLSHAVMAAADMAETVELIRGAVNSTVEEEVLRRCRSDAPAAGTRAPLTKEELMRLPVAELQRIRNMGTELVRE